MIRFTKEEKIAVIFLLISLFVGVFAVYLRGKVSSSASSPPAFFALENEKEAVEKLNINTASEEGLVKLKHIGPVLAKRIIDYREQYGPFAYLEDLKNVRGIGEKTYEKIKIQIKLE